MIKITVVWKYFVVKKNFMDNETHENLRITQNFNINNKQGAQ